MTGRFTTSGSAPSAETSSFAEGVANTAPARKLGDAGDRSIPMDRAWTVPSGWSPSRRPPRHPIAPVPRPLMLPAAAGSDDDPASWTFVSFQTDAELGQVRTNMSFAAEFDTSVMLSEKTGRLVFLEGANEPAVAEHLEMSPRSLAFLFQPAVMTFRAPSGTTRRSFLDVAIEWDDHAVRFGEIKTDASWFQAPAVARKLDRVSRELEREGLGPLLRIAGAPFRTEAAQEAHRAAFDARLTVFDEEHDVAAAQAVVRAAGGSAPYGRVVAALADGRAGAADRLYAMMLRRHVSLPLWQPPSHDTPVTIPRPSRPYALRDTLLRYAPTAGSA